MKKSKILGIIVLSLLFSQNVFSQRHIKGIKALDFGSGLTGRGYYLQGGYAHYLSSKDYITATAKYENGTMNDSLVFNGVSLNVGYNRTLFKINQSFFANGKAGLFGHFNSLKNDIGGGSEDNVQRISYDVKNKQEFTYGPFLGVETEWFLSNRLVLLLNAQQNYSIISSYGNWSWYAGAGIRFNIY